MNLILAPLLVVLLALAGAHSQRPKVKEIPEWPTAYSVDGRISIPFAEIEEPFEAYFDSKKGKSRVDYYGGMDKTFQIAGDGPSGTMYKVIPETTEVVLNKIRCFKSPGSSDAPVTVQSVLPDLEGFEMKGMDIYHGQDVEKWQKKVTFGHKVNKYTMWIKRMSSPVDPDLKTPVPVHYEMKGFNNLLGSHYDHYYIAYGNFEPKSPPESIFDGYKAMGPCTGWPGPGVQSEESNEIKKDASLKVEKHMDVHVQYAMNPAKEFVEDHSKHVDEEFERFKVKHPKSYKDEKEHETRKDIFRQNQRYIHSKNRENLGYKMAANHMTDWTSGEMRQLRGRLHTPGYNGGQPFHYTAKEVASTPASMDWRLYGAVAPVKDQSMCGSCWSFGTVGSLEGARFLQTGELVELSQQSLVDCSWGFGNNGCDGGEDTRVYQFMLAHGGIPSDEDYGPYLGQDGYCHIKQTKPSFQISSYVNVTEGSNEALRVAIAKHGPASVSIDAGHKSFSFYSSGVYYEPKCKNTPGGLDHSVLAAGYGTLNGKEYWLVKNSWSTHWGNDGYVLMSAKDNDCGVATAATFVNPKK